MYTTGWPVEVPTFTAGDDLQFVQLRRCAHDNVLMAHILYRRDGRLLSLFVMPEPEPDHSGRLEGRPPGGDQEDVMIQSAIKIGVIAEQTGPLSFMGIADANVAKMVVDDINTSGGLLGRQLALCLEDGATIGSTYCSVGSTAPRDRRSRAPSRRAARYTSTPSSTKVRRRTRSSSAPARCRRSSSNRSFRG